LGLGCKENTRFGAAHFNLLSLIWPDHPTSRFVFAIRNII